MKDMQFVFLGMAIQAIVVSFLTKIGAIIPTSRQQFLAGVTFAAIFVLVSVYRNTP